MDAVRPWVILVVYEACLELILDVLYPLRRDLLDTCVVRLVRKLFEGVVEECFRACACSVLDKALG
jgi:hypothetical protein